MDGRVEAAPEGPAQVEEAPSEAPRDISGLVAELRRIVGDEWVYTAEHQLRTYESDGLLQYHATPAAAVLPNSTEEVAGDRAGVRARGGRRGSRAAPAPGSPAARCRSRTASCSCSAG